MRHFKSRPEQLPGFMLSALLLLLLLLAGCAGQSNWSWQHPQGLGQSEALQAIAFCQSIADDEINRHDYFFPYYSHYSYYDNRDYRDRRTFYSSTLHYQQRQRFLDRQRYFRICMTSKGWEKGKNSAIAPAKK